MKTIEVTDEMYAKLIELATEMTTQDMRHTSMPHMFQIRTIEEVAAYDGCGEEVWVDNEGDELKNEDEISQWIYDDILEQGKFDVHIEGKEIAKQKTKEKVQELKDLCELEDYLEESGDGWRRVSVTTEEKFQNTFFTAKACQEHIDKNHYHYNSPTVYLNHAWRNPEMELVSEFLCNLVGKSNHK